jgi:hypothetical protein
MTMRAGFAPSTRANMMRIAGEAITLDAAKTQCGQRAVDWIKNVLARFAR